VESHRQALDHAKHVHGAVSAELGAELERNQVELNAAGTKLELLTGQLKEREIELDAARAECDRLTCEQQTTLDEIKALKSTLAERDSALRDQSDQLAAQVESHRQALDHAKHVHGDMIEALEAQLAALGERFGQLLDEHRSAQESCKQFQDRDRELTEAQQRLESTYQSMLDAERTKHAELAQQLDELRADSAESARLAEQLISAKSGPVESPSAADAELEAARAQVKELHWLVAESERLILETAAVLNGFGVRRRPTAST
jgi:chromosome segregation ATPase